LLQISGNRIGGVAINRRAAAGAWLSQRRDFLAGRSSCPALGQM